MKNTFILIILLIMGATIMALKSNMVATIPLEINLKTFSLPKTPNYYLVCPENYCQAQANQVSPIFNIPLSQLNSFWNSFVAKLPRLTTLLIKPPEHYYVYQQRTKWLRFPDFIYVKLIALNNKQSTLVLFSRSKYGRSDFGKNKQRITLWLKKLKELIDHHYKSQNER